MTLFDRLLVAAGRRKRTLYSLFLAVLSRFVVLFSDRRIFVTYFLQYFAVSRIAGAKIPFSCHCRLLSLKLQWIGQRIGFVPPGSQVEEPEVINNAGLLLLPLKLRRI